MTEDAKKKRVLFLTRQYAPTPKVCEICVKRIREALHKRGIMSDVLQFTGDKGIVEELPYGRVYSIGEGQDRFNTTIKSKFFHMIILMTIAYRWPLFFSYSINAKYKNMIRELQRENQYDAIIGIARPVDTALAGVGYQNYIFYELDAITNNPQNSGKGRKLFAKRISKMEEKVFNNASLIIHMECNRSYFAKEKYKRYKDKFVYSDIPNLIEFDRTRKQSRNDKIILAYFGTLVEGMRSPSYFIRLIESIKEKEKIECEFYSRGNCEDILKRAEESNPGVFFSKGYVSPEQVIINQERADFLLSIGNTLSGEDRSLPSKVLEYISTGKPIIHIYGGENDSAVDYLEKYELSCVIYPNDPLEANASKFVNFMKYERGKRLSFEEVKQLFPKNSPDYTAEIIYNYLCFGVHKSII